MKLKDYQNAAQLRAASPHDLDELASDIREKIVDVVQHNNNGHLGSNLGIVEVTISLLRVFDLDNRDLILFDTGHETYPFKILTGRLESFPTIRSFHGLSGFQEITESKYDALSNGHAGTALSTAIGYAYTQQYRNIVVVIGDAAFLNGMNLEALSHLGMINHKITIVLNDNGMSISKNISIIQKWSSKVRANSLYLWFDRIVHFLKYIPILQVIYWMYCLYVKLFRHLEIPGLFTGFNLDYIGPVNGHNISKLCRFYKLALKKNRSTVVHVITKKGYGYEPALKDDFRLHSFSKIGSLALPDAYCSWGECAAKLIEQHFNDHHYFLVCAAMQSSTCMTPLFKKHADHCIDVGISEEHAVTLSSGLLLGKQKVIISLYSTFMQRAFDQLLHDVIRNKLNPILLIDRAGLNGGDGISHHGIYDVGMLKATGDAAVIAQPCCDDELARMFDLALANQHYPFVIRYPKSQAPLATDFPNYLPITRCGQWTCVYHQKSNRICFLAYGDDVLKAYRLIVKNHLPIDLINACFLQPYDHAMINDFIFSGQYSTVASYEQIVGASGLAGILETEFSRAAINVRKSIRLMAFYFRDGQIYHGNNDQLLSEVGMDLADVIERIVHQR